MIYKLKPHYPFTALQMKEFKIIVVSYQTKACVQTFSDFLVSISHTDTCTMVSVMYSESRAFLIHVKGIVHPRAVLYI